MSGDDATAFTETARLSFHGEPHVVTVTGLRNDSLSVEVERDSDGARWVGDFGKRYVEDIAAKTGSFKKFAVFSKMLRAGLVDSSSAVFVDLLTYQDLEQLKRRRSGGAGGAVGVETSFDGPKPDANAPSNVSRGKRYLILTHADEFDRTHYPLPLLFEDEPSCATLMAQVARLKQENELLRRDAGPGGDVSGVIGRGALSGRDDDEMDSLRLENERLTDRLDVVESGAGDASYENAPPHYAQMSALQQEVKVLTRELGATKRDLVEVQKAAKGFAVEVQNAESSKTRMVAKKQRELDDALGDIQRRRETERELRIQVKDLTTTCDGLERRLRASGGGYVRPVSRPVSRPTSRSNSVERSYQRPWAERQPAHHRPPVGRNASNTGGFRTPASGTTPTRGRSPSPGAYRSAGVRDAASPSTRGRDRTPRSPRFDPTAYVQEKRQREEARFMSSARGLASGAASPARERERGTHGGYSREASPAPGRHGRSPSPGGGGVNSGFGGGASRGPWASSSPGRRKSNENQAPVGSNATRNATATTGRATTRSASPGRVLRDVQRRLVSVVASDGTGSKSTDATSAKPKRRPSNSSHGLLTDDSQLRRPKEHASSEIADIDSRLAALQMFLREAKQVGSPREKEAA